MLERLWWFVLDLFLSSSFIHITDDPFQFPIFFKFIKSCLFLSLLGLRCCSGFSLLAVSGGDSLAAIHSLLVAVTSFLEEHRLQSTGSIVVVGRLSFSKACGIFLDQGSNPCLLHWQADTLPLSHQETPQFHSFNTIYSVIIPKCVVLSILQGNTAMRKAYIPNNRTPNRWSRHLQNWRGK